MSEAFASHSDTSASMPFWWSEPHSITEEFDDAVSTFDLPRMHAIAAQSENGLSFNSKLAFSKLRMQQIALPAYEQIYSLFNEEGLDESLLHRLDGMHQRSLDFIEDVSQIRDSLGRKNLLGTEVASGALSEAVFQALLNQEGSNSLAIAIPSSQKADFGSISSYGERNGYDFLVYSPYDLNTAVKVQVKTDSIHHDMQYTNGIHVVSMHHLIHHHIDSLPDSTLSDALIAQNRSESTPRQDFIVEEASEILNKFIKNRRMIEKMR